MRVYVHKLNYLFQIVKIFMYDVRVVKGKVMAIKCSLINYIYLELDLNKICSNFVIYLLKYTSKFYLAKSKNCCGY